MEFLNLENGRVLTLKLGGLTTLGRGPDSGISSLSVSRNHCTIIYDSEIPDAKSITSRDEDAPHETLGQAHNAVHVRLTVIHPSGAAVIRGPYSRRLGLEPLSFLPAESTCQLYPGDRIYLERRDARLVSGLELRAAAAATQAEATHGSVAAAAANPVDDHSGSFSAQQGKAVAVVSPGKWPPSRTRSASAPPLPSPSSTRAAAEGITQDGGAGGPATEPTAVAKAANAEVSAVTTSPAVAAVDALLRARGSSVEAPVARGPSGLPQPRRVLPSSFRRHQQQHAQAVVRTGGAASAVAAAATEFAAIATDPGVSGSAGMGSLGRTGGGRCGREGTSPAAKRQRRLLSPPPLPLATLAAAPQSAGSDCPANVTSVAVASTATLAAVAGDVLAAAAAAPTSRSSQPALSVLHLRQPSSSPVPLSALAAEQAATAAAVKIYDDKTGSDSEGGRSCRRQLARLHSSEPPSTPPVGKTPNRLIALEGRAAGGGGGGGDGGSRSGAAAVPPPVQPVTVVSGRMTPSPVAAVSKVDLLRAPPVGDVSQMQTLTPVVSAPEVSERLIIPEGTVAAVSERLITPEEDTERLVMPAPGVLLEAAAIVVESRSDGADRVSAVLAQSAAPKATPPRQPPLPPALPSRRGTATATATGAGGSPATAALSSKHDTGKIGAVDGGGSVGGGGGRSREVGGGGGGSDKIFSGCRFVFWARSQSRDLLAQVKQQGGQEQYSLGPRTTHVVARYDTSAEEASRLLRSSDLQYGNTAAAAAAAASTTSPSPFLPVGVLFVTPEYLRDCLAKPQLRLQVRQDAQRRQRQQQQQQQQHLDAARSDPTESPGAAAADATFAGMGVGIASEAGGMAEGEGARGNAAIPAVAATAGGGGSGDAVEVRQERILPSPADICARPEDWGVEGRWIEPWDPQAASRTCMLLLRHWAKPFCILAELKRTRDLYMDRRDQFRIKAIDRGMGVLARVSWPLESPDQLSQLRLGRGTAEKVSEILATGRFSRNDMFEQDEQRMTMMKFMQVWGCGESTARSWWASGARSLDDVRQRTDLTVRQRLGLRHFDDFQRRIPRAEITQIAAVVRQVTIETLRRSPSTVWDSALTQLPDADLLDRLHVRPMGSYVRGHTSSADVVQDFIIAPSPQADPRVGPYELLLAIVDRLNADGYLDPESACVVETQPNRAAEEAIVCYRDKTTSETLTDLPPSGLYSRSDSSQNRRPVGRYRRRREMAGSLGVRVAREPVMKPENEDTVTAVVCSRRTHIITVQQRGVGVVVVVVVVVVMSPGRGMWRNPNSGCYCRIDIKCYRRRLLPFAVTYFGSGMDFNRALRYWASTPLPHVRQLAQSVHPRAEAFRLSDKGLEVVERRWGRGGEPAAGGRGAGTSGSVAREGLAEYVVATVPCRCETDIFQALGLDYVPLHMRDITRVN
ncbi:hypothetical protein VOLCADRAFT_96792 [Volvox carteri f. nagariensis]|uniref:DNA polymerase lambda n=1 Tax=Volvox carteri f. nagariensis TaxID=3068 RepID=D8UB26_VOLCA|nr:uncharacterized protein VOLCADRAFT_96792 [Volvox carteri f. nagariensis]EFJ43097.1 hypothetical protein VOLCADRAFT_96792 [Volvox carteri f. nagariensis]|eukprot:XP_002955896.1 hypothetical protein VOLCADRAFT_96792 [Volvox carteri f. nagariensis]